MTDFNKYIKLIQEQSNTTINYRERKCFKLNNNMLVSFWENEQGIYLNGLQYVKNYKDIGWIWSNPKEFYEKYCNNDKQLRFIQHSVRFYGEPKLTKPKELKGVKQIFSIDYISNKCKCKIFIKDNDVWIQHRDYFSDPISLPSEEQGLPLGILSQKYCKKSLPAKFIYNDSWGEITLRNEAWLCLKNLIYRLKIGEFEPDLEAQILRQQEITCKFRPFELEVSDMARFFEKVIYKIREYINTNNKPIKN